MEAQLLHGVNLALDFWNNLPGHWYYTIGVVLASIPLTAVIVQGVKKLHLKYTSTEMTTHLIDFVVLVTGFLMAAADFVITNGSNTKYLPQFLLVVVPTIKALAPSVYTYSKAINSWFVNRKNESQKDRIAATVKLANSFGTAANGITTDAQSLQSVPQPVQKQPDLLQL
jgi:hypothetical protein